MVTSPTGRGVIVIGGMSFGAISKNIFELSASMQWTRLEQTLQINHRNHFLLTIPDELVNEKIEAKNKRRRLQNK